MIHTMRQIFRSARRPGCDDLADKIAAELVEPVLAPLIEQDRTEADQRQQKADDECERLETALIDLDTQYEQTRRRLVSDLTEARQARAAAAIWADALHPGALLTEEKSDG